MFRKPRRCLTAFLAIFALLISQLAVAAHACGHINAVAQAELVAQAESSGPCPEPMFPSILCQQHCQFGQSNVDQGKPFASVDVTSAPASPIDQPYASLLLVPRSGHDSPPPPEPPPAIRFSVLRI